MWKRSDTLRQLGLFMLRNLVLYFLLVNSFLQLRGDLDLIFLSSSFLIAVLASLWMERSRLRFLPSLALAAILPIALRALFFLVFRFQRTLAEGPATDFLYFYFDRDFFPSLAPFAIAWLFNFLALRHRGFPVIEVGLNSLLLVAVFWTQASYRITIYPHPSLFAWAIAFFVIAELFVLLLARGSSRKIELRAILSFAWIIVPLLLIFLLFLLGRYSEGAVEAGGGLMKPTLFRFDFAPYVRLESEIHTSDEPVLLFRTEGKASRYLLRRFVLSGYDHNRGFFMDKENDIDDYPSVVPDAREVFPDPGYRNRQNIDQEYYFLTIDPTSLIAINYPLRVVPMKNWQSSSFLRVYNVESYAMLSMVSTARVKDPPNLPRVALAFYTHDGDDQRIKELAERVTAGISGYYGKVAAISDYLKTNYLYSLKPGIAADGNQLHHFLFESRKGYCSYFAFAMALMARSLGIPARVSVGFYVDPQSEVLNFYEVRAFQAHAWVEVFFGNLGWVEFDPTSQTLAPGEEVSFFTGPDMDSLSKLIKEILENQGQLEEDQPPREGLPSAASRAASAIARAARIVARLWYITLPLLYAMYLLAVKLGSPLAGLCFASARGKARSLYRLCLTRLQGAALGRRAKESHSEYAERMETDRGIRLSGITEAFLKSVFSDCFGAEDLKAARNAHAAFLESYRSRVPLAWRILGVLNPIGALRVARPHGRVR